MLESLSGSVSLVVELYIQVCVLHNLTVLRPGATLWWVNVAHLFLNQCSKKVIAEDIGWL